MARSLHMSLRRFDGWVPQQETTYEHDERGVLVRSSSWTETEWDAEQQGWMLAYAQLERERCTGCGLSLRETLDPANEYAYTAEEPWVCAGCAAIHRGQQQYPDELTPAHRFVPEAS